jgi:hypothetical protein
MSGASDGGSTGEPGGAAGAAGMAEGGGGAGGAGGASPVVEQAKLCLVQCETQQDCAGSGSDLVVCNLETHTCVDQASTCSVDDDCWAHASNWTATCQTDDDCGGDTCVAFRGVGVCAILADGAGSCDPYTLKTLPRFGADAMVDVCVNTSGDRCVDGTCTQACNDPTLDANRCSGGTGDTCNPDTGRCECQTDDECTSNVCGPDHHCVECVTNDQCHGFGLDTCVNGKCGCGSADSCPAQGTATIVCK